MSKTKVTAVLSVFSVLVATMLITSAVNIGTSKASTPPSQFKEDLGTFSLGIISVANPTLSKARRQLLARTFVRVATDIFDNEEDRRQFAFVILAESSFNPKIEDSPKGAVGLAQVLPVYSKEFGKLCNVPDFNIEDLKDDPELNMTVGGCLFRSLIEEYKGNSALAHAAYIAGKNSLSVKQLRNLHNVDDSDVTKYLAKFFYLKEASRLGIPLKSMMVKQ